MASQVIEGIRFYTLGSCLAPPTPPREELIREAIASFAAVSRSEAARYLAVLVAPEFAKDFGPRTVSEGNRSLYGMPYRISALLPPGWPFAYVSRAALGL